MLGGEDAETVHTLLCQGLLHRDLQAVAQLLEAGGDPNSRSTQATGPYAGDTPLTLAARMGSLDAVQLLVHARADVEIAGPRRLTALHEAAGYGRTPVVKMLLACGAPTAGPSARHQTPWRSPRAVEAASTASTAGSTAGETGDGIVCSVAREGSVVLSDTEGGQEHDNSAPQYTPLHAAAEWGKEDALVVLLEAGANLYHVDDSGQTAEDLAVAAQRQREAQGYTQAAEARGRCAQLLKSYRKADQAQRRVMSKRCPTESKYSDSIDEDLDGGGDTDARLRGYAAALGKCPESVRWRHAVLAEIEVAAGETETLFADTAELARKWAEEDTQHRIDDRAKVIRSIAQHAQRLEAEMEARIQKAAHEAERRESARKWALKSAVQKFTKAQKEANAAKLRLANGKTEMHSGWAVMRESIVAKLADEAQSSKLTMVAAATQLTELRKEQVRQAEQDAAAMRHSLANAKHDAEHTLAAGEPGHKEEDGQFYDSVASARCMVEASKVAAAERATVLASFLNAMRSAAQHRLASLDQCEAVLHESAMYMARKSNDSMIEGGGSGEQEQGQETAVAVQELQEGSERCLALSADLRMMRTAATLTCGGALHAQTAFIECLEELRKLRLQHTVLASIRQGSAGVVSKKSADDMAQAWMQKTLRPHSEQDKKRASLAKDLDVHGTESVGSRSHCKNEGLVQWVELLGRCIGAQLSILVAPALQPDIEDEPRRSPIVLAKVAEARLAQCRDEATRLGCRARAALGIMPCVELASGAGSAVAATTARNDATSAGQFASHHGSEKIAAVLVQQAIAELRLYVELREAAQSHADAKTASPKESVEEEKQKQHEQNLQMLKTAESSLFHALQQ